MFFWTSSEGRQFQCYCFSSSHSVFDVLLVTNFILLLFSIIQQYYIHLCSFYCDSYALFEMKRDVFIRILEKFDLKSTTNVKFWLKNEQYCIFLVHFFDTVERAKKSVKTIVLRLKCHGDFHRFLI